MDIRGLTKFSLIDFPGKLSCIVYVGGCNFRCPYCHNPHLVVDPESQHQLSDSSILNFLEKRKGKLEGVVISGGEPSTHPGLIGFLEKIKSIGYLTKLDTNGSSPDVIINADEKGLIDMLGLDYKTASSFYSEIAKCRIENIVELVHKTISYAIEKKMIADIRTTVHKRFHSPEILKTMRDELNNLGVGEWTLQQFHPAEVIDNTLSQEATYSDAELIELARILGNHTRIRGLKGSVIFRA